MKVHGRIGKLKPAHVGKRNIEELVQQIKLYVDFLRKKGLKIIWKS